MTEKTQEKDGGIKWENKKKEKEKSGRKTGNQ